MRRTLNENKYQLFFLLSLLIHLALMISSEFLPQTETSSKSIEVEILDSKHSVNDKSQQVVRNAEIPLDKIIESTKKTDLLSERTVRVKEQIRAKKSGLTQNRSFNSNTKKNQFLSKILPQLNGQGEYIPKSKTNYSPGFSTVSEDLPSDIKIGDMTILDADQYLYYSFISRAGESFYYEWAPLVQSILENPPVLLRAKGPGKYKTILEVWFLPSGKIHSTHILKPSGVPEFDFAASRSFKAVAMVPNPPKQKLDADGFIRFTWQLSVNYESKALVRK